MPLYEYKCDSCGNRFEVLQKFADAPLSTHEGCGGHVERLLSAPAFHFKGTGWYVTDYAKSNGKSPKSTESEKSGGSPAKSGDSASSSDSAKKEARESKEKKADTAGNSESKSSSTPPPAAPASTSTSEKK